jgi:peptidoglycan/LPS O-acetylase OafA/YrhL
MRQQLYTVFLDRRKGARFWMMLFALAWACACLFAPLFITPTSGFSGLAWLPQHVWGMIMLALFAGQLSILRKDRLVTLALLFLVWLVIAVGVTLGHTVNTGTFIYSVLALMAADIMLGGAE